jgi:hypothetical protein
VEASKHMRGSGTGSVVALFSCDVSRRDEKGGKKEKKRKTCLGVSKKGEG